MECKRCGAELKEGCLYCSVCGEEAQMVNGYTVLEDDYLRSILAKEAAKGTEEKVEDKDGGKNTSSKAAPSGKKMSSKTPLIIVLCILFIAIITGVAIKLYIDHKNSNSYDYQMAMASEQLIDKNYENALSYYKNALALQPNDISARMAMADIYMSEADYDSAMVLLMEVIRLDASNKDAYQMLISIYEEQQEYTKIAELAANISDDEILDLFEEYIVNDPVFYPEGGEYDSYITVTLLSIDDYEIFYTKDGSDPLSGGILYDEKGIALESTGSFTIRAVCRSEKGIYSDVVEATFDVEAAPPDYPTVTPDGGSYDELTYVTIEAEENCSIYYTWDGTEPNRTSFKYTEPIEIPEGNNILSIIVIDDRSGLSSEIYRTNFIYFHQ